MSLLIGVDEVRWLLDGTRRPVLLDTRAAGTFAGGHLPGAIQVDARELDPDHTTLDGIYSFHGDVDALYRVIGRFEKCEFIVYGGETDAEACRIVWLMRYAGQHAARLLDGGFGAWTASGAPASTDPPVIDPAPFPVRSNPKLLARHDEIHGLLADGRTMLIDSRSAAEHQAGALPGSVCWPAADLLEAGRFRPIEALAASAAGAGLEADRPAVVYSNRGRRSSVAWIALRELGHRKVRNYLGGCAEWEREQAAG
jgi:thiosulfate/3-mercaptopyruvate sulfurtransferase